MRTPEQHYDAVAALLKDREQATLALGDAAGLTLAADIRADHASPRFDNSQMDGYAVFSIDEGTYSVGPTIPAGADPDGLYPRGLDAESVVAPIMTGAKLPQGTVAVIPVERATPAEFVAEGGTVTLPAAAAGQFIRPTASDIAAGEVLLSRGTRLSPAAIGTLASQGITEAPVVAPARIVIVTGGAEIGTDGTAEAGPGDARIPDSNAPMLAALAREHGIVVAGFVRTDDDPAKLREDLAGAIRLHRPDAIVSSGGISHGAFEVVRQVFGADGWFGHVAQQPGGPQGLGQLDGVPAICLPGNPVSSLVSFRLYVAPLLGHAAPPVTARLRQAVRGLQDKDQFLRGVREVSEADAVVYARPVGGAGSHLLAQSTPATCLLRVPAGAELAEGETLKIYPL